MNFVLLHILQLAESSVVLLEMYFNVSVMQMIHCLRTKQINWDMTAVFVDSLIYLKRKPGMLCCAVIAGELGCLSLITYILCPPPGALVIGLSDFHHPLPMFSLTPCIYNMLEQPLECKDPTEALSKHTHTHTGFTYTHRCRAL